MDDCSIEHINVNIYDKALALWSSFINEWDMGMKWLAALPLITLVWLDMERNVKKLMTFWVKVPTEKN